MTHTYHVTLPDGMQRTFISDGHDNLGETHLAAVQTIAKRLVILGHEVAGAKVQRVVGKYRGA